MESYFGGNFYERSAASMIQYIKPSCWAWILADLKRKEGTKERCIWGGYRYYIHRVYECTAIRRCPQSQEPTFEADELVAYFAKGEF